MADTVITTASGPSSWGPKVWRMYHLLAEISDRRDISLLWKKLICLTADVLPCAQCRHHLGQYLRTHTFIKTSSHLASGAYVRTQIRLDLYTLHNDVNVRTGKAIFSPSDLTVYSGKSRAEQLVEVLAIYDELKAMWTPLIHKTISASALNEWKNTFVRLCSIVAGGPN